MYSKVSGFAAVLIVGFYFMEEFLDRILKKGVEILYVILYVGFGIFKFVKVENVEEYKMYEEYYEIF